MRNLFAARLAVTTLAVAALAIACPKPDGAPLPEPTPSGASSQPVVGANAHPGENHAEHAAGAGDREHADADGVVRRGNPLSPDLEILGVSAAVARAKELDGKKVKLRGTVTSVCQPMGCWFVVRGDKPEDTVRISTKAHNIFVPKSATGKIATVEGVITIKVLDQKTAQHYEDERELKDGETKKTFTGDVTELAIDVLGLIMEAA